MLDIAVWPDEILKKETRVVTSFDEEIEFLIDRMFETMISKNALGLAANQVNLDKRMLVMKTADGYKAMINPTIIELSKEKVKSSEGCLSFPGFVVDVERSKEVTVQYNIVLDHRLKLITETLTGIDSIVAAHEIDHLDGITFLKYTSRFHRSMITNRMSR